MHAERLLPHIHPEPRAHARPLVPTNFTTYTKYYNDANKGSLTIQFAPPPNNDFAALYISNKIFLRKALTSVVRPEFRLLIFAMAMQETNTMSPRERDWTKDDNNIGSRNHTIFNLNEAFLRYAGHNPGPPPINPPAELSMGVPLKPFLDALVKGFADWGVIPTLGFHRGGETTFFTYDKKKKLSAADWKRGRNAIDNYYRAIKQIVITLQNDESLWTNPVRICIDVKHKSDADMK